MKTAEEVRQICFDICEQSFGTKTDTIRSLARIDEVLLRFDNVDWTRLKADGGCKTSPGKPSRLIRDVGEKAAQRAYFFLGKTKIGLDEVQWLDAEIPICPGKSPRRRCMDLFGHWRANSNHHVLAELKFSMRYGNSPAYALFEALAYGASLYANRNSADLRGHGSVSLKVDTFPDLIVAANRSYWNSWRELSLRLFELSSGLERVLATPFSARPPRILWACFSDIDFRIQRGPSDTYEPKVPPDSTDWKLLVSAEEMKSL